MKNAPRYNGICVIDEAADCTSDNESDSDEDVLPLNELVRRKAEKGGRLRRSFLSNSSSESEEDDDEREVEKGVEQGISEEFDEEGPKLVRNRLMFRGSELPPHKPDWALKFIQEEGRFPSNYFDEGRVFRDIGKKLTNCEFNSSLNAYIRTDVESQSSPQSGNHPKNCYWVPLIHGWRIEKNWTREIEEPDTSTTTAQPAKSDLFGISDEQKQHFNYSWWSITIGKKGAHCPTSWFDQLIPFFDENFEEGSMGQEVGDKKGHLHNQCSYGTWVQGNGEAAKDAIVKAIKEILYIQPGDKANVVVKLANLNDKKYLTGYTQKQAGKDTYRFWSKGLSVDYLAESKYSMMRHQHNSERTSLVFLVPT